MRRLILTMMLLITIFSSAIPLVVSQVKADQPYFYWPVYDFQYIAVNYDTDDSEEASSGSYNGHHGVDIPVSTDATTPIFAAASGKVVAIESGHSYGLVRYTTDGGGLGNYVKIEHPNGYFSVYAHFGELNVVVNQEVQVGEILGYGSNSGFTCGSEPVTGGGCQGYSGAYSHLHFEVQTCANGCHIDPKDLFFKNSNGEYLQARDRYFITPKFGSFAPNEIWYNSTLPTHESIYFADLTGDKANDLILINGDNIYVSKANSNAFNATFTLWGTRPSGSESTSFRDVTGDGKADLVVVKPDGVFVKNSLGGSFSTNSINWTNGAFYGNLETYFEDVTGDGKADAIAHSTQSIVIRRSNGTGFSGNEVWLDGEFWGTEDTLFKDVTGDGKVDAIAYSDQSITIRRSNGDNFLPNEVWLDGQFYGNMNTFVEDVTGDKAADFVAHSSQGVTIRRSNTNDRFEENELWLNTGFWGNIDTYFSDVTGDGKADAIAISTDQSGNSIITIRRAAPSFSAETKWLNQNLDIYSTFFEDVNGDNLDDIVTITSAGVIIRKSNGNGSFQSAENWTGGGFWGNRTTFVKDVTGDGKADVIAHSTSSIVVRRSNGSAFSANETWVSGSFWGNIDTFVEDVTGDGKADLIAHSQQSITIRRSDGNSFQPNEVWLSGEFWGNRKTLFEDVTGDGAADAIAHSSNGITIRRSNTVNAFEANENWLEGEFFGNIGTYFQDVTGDNAADLIALSQQGITVRRSDGNRFLPNEKWNTNSVMTGSSPGSNPYKMGDLNGDNKFDFVRVEYDGVGVRLSF